MKSRQNPEYRRRLFERLGIFDPPATTPTIWVHAVSVGETIAAAPLIQKIQQQFPNMTIVMTTHTPTGSAQVTRLLKDQVFHVYSPFDVPFAVKNFLRHSKPALAIIMETELWPNLLHYCGKQSIPLMLANGRLSPRSLSGYQRIAALSQQMLANFSMIAAQTQADADRFQQLGAPANKLMITGSIKFDITLPAELTEQAVDMRQRWGKQRPIFIAASTHPGEEEQVLDAFAKILEKAPDCLLVLVPRHPQRFTEVSQLCHKRGFSVELYSDDKPCAETTQIFIGDTMGKLLLFYAAADVAFVGGSLVPTGGHNLIEAAVLTKPVLTGPHLFNFTEISRLLTDAGGAIIINDSNALANQATALLQDPQQCQQIGNKGKQAIDQNRGAIDKHLTWITTNLNNNPFNPIPTIQAPKNVNAKELSELAEYGIAYIPIPEKILKKLKLIESIGTEYFKLPKEQKKQHPFTPEIREGFIDQTLKGYNIERYIIRKSLPMDPAWKRCGTEMLEVKDYFKHAIIQPLLFALFKHLKIDPEKIRIHFEKADSTLSVTYYPKCDATEARKRIRPHEDAALMTILWSQKPGLEAKIDNEWQSNLVKQGHIIVHLGEGLKLMTDNRCHAVTHCVQTPDNTSRLSIASFYTPNIQEGFFNAVTNEKIANTFAEYAASNLEKAYPAKSPAE